MERERRSFFKNLLGELTKSALAGVKEADDAVRDSFDDFFDSYESSYALTLNYPDEILLETAKNQGIEVEGRDKLDIVKEMFARQEGDDHRP